VAWDGPVTFMFTDVVGSTALLQRLGDDEGEQWRRRLFAEFRDAAASTGGDVVKNLGDGLMLAFVRPADALRCAAAMQRSAAVAGASLRAAVHVGEATREDGDYFGTPVVIASRLCDQAAGGQVLVSELVAELVGSKGSFVFDAVDRLKLKGIGRPVAASSFRWELVDVDGDTGVAPPPALAPPLWVSRGRVGLAGRTAELELLAGEFQRTCRGELRVVLVVGDPGLGKTRLGAELLALVATSDPAPTVITARAHWLGSSSSLALWVEGLDVQLRARSLAAVERLCGSATDDLTAVLRSVAAARPARVVGEPSRDRLVGGMAELIGNLASEGPLVVVLDDVHLADPLSWELLARLARQLADRSVLIVATARPVELAEHAVAPEVLTVLDHDGCLVRMELEALTETEVGALASSVLDRPPPSGLVAWLMERSRGNALFAIVLLQALVDAGADLAAPELTTLPEGVTGMVASRMRGLATEDRATLELLAVLGRRVEVAELIRLSGTPLERLGVILERLVRVRLVVEEDRGARLLYEVAHPLIQEAIYQSIGAARRRVVHRAVARTLLAGGQRSAAAAHFVRSASVGDDEAIDALTSAMGQAEERALHREAMVILSNLVEIIEPGDERWIPVLDAMDPDADWVVSHLAEDDVDASVDALLRIEAVLEATGQGDSERMAVAQFRLGTFVGFSQGHAGEGIARCHRAARLFEQAGSVTLSLLAENEAGYLVGCEGDLAGEVAAARGVLAKAEALGNERVMLNALACISMAVCAGCHLGEALAATDRGTALADAMGHRYRSAWFRMEGADARASMGALAEALVLTDAAVADAASLDSMAAEYGIEVQWKAGNLDPALRCLSLAVGRNRRAVSRRQGPGLANGGRTLVEAGRADEARELFARALAAYDGREFGYFYSMVRALSSILRWHDGDRLGALDDLERSVRWLSGMGADGMAATAAMDLGEVAAETRDARRAELAVAVTCDLGDGAPIMPAIASMTRAARALALGHPDDAVADARRAAELFETLGYRLYHGRALLLLARASARSERANAIASAQAAAEVFSECGAAWHVIRAAEVLKGLGSRGKRIAGAVSGPAALTGREREVALLAAAGNTAKQIAARLFIGERTVETHLANAYAKLGVTSKQELAGLSDAIRTGYGGNAS
jgi:DNA-binding CsgD family transcriptional regulator